MYWTTFLRDGKQCPLYLFLLFFSWNREAKFRADRHKYMQIGEFRCDLDHIEEKSGWIHKKCQKVLCIPNQKKTSCFFCLTIHKTCWHFLCIKPLFYVMWNNVIYITYFFSFSISLSLSFHTILALSACLYVCLFLCVSPILFISAHVEKLRYMMGVIISWNNTNFGVVIFNIL